MRTVMVISPHADDAAAFCGGTLARFVSEGWTLVFVRVTDDAKDAVGMSEAAARAANAAEARAAAEALGALHFEDLDFPTDTLADVPLGNLRERFVYLFRKHRPYAVFSFDPFGLYEGNMDHIRVAQAVEEAYWVSCFDLHYPEHFAEGLAPFAVCERWYFARRLPETNQVIDTTDHAAAKVNALCANATMLRNVLRMSTLQLETWGKRVPMLDAAMDGALAPVLAEVIRQQDAAAAAAHGLPEGRLAETFRLVRFGPMEPLFQALAEPIPGAPPPPIRQGLDPA